MLCKNESDQLLYDTLCDDPSNTEKIKQLVEQGANINAVDDDGVSIFMDLCSFPGGSGDKDLSDEERLAGIKTAIEMGADIHCVTKENANCLHFANMSYYPPLIKLLLEAGVNPNLISDGETPLDYAQCDKQIEETGGNPEYAEKMSEIIKLLKQHGAKKRSEIV